MGIRETNLPVGTAEYLRGINAAGESIKQLLTAFAAPSGSMTQAGLLELTTAIEALDHTINTKPITPEGLWGVVFCRRGTLADDTAVAMPAVSTNRFQMGMCVIGDKTRSAVFSIEPFPAEGLGTIAEGAASGSLDIAATGAFYTGTAGTNGVASIGMQSGSTGIITLENRLGGAALYLVVVIGAAA